MGVASVIICISYLLPRFLLIYLDEFFIYFFQYSLFEKNEHYIIAANFITFSLILVILIAVIIFYKKTSLHKE